MMRSLILGFVIIGFCYVSNAAIESVSINEAKTLREKLTGVKPAEKNTVVQKKQSLKTVAHQPAAKKSQSALANPAQQKAVALKPSQKGLALAREAKAKKDYILAIKRYNFILKYFAKSPEAKMALLDKAEIYKDMGLEEQSAYNRSRAQKLNVQAMAPTNGNKIKK